MNDADVSLPPHLFVNWGAELIISRRTSSLCVDSTLAGY